MSEDTEVSAKSGKECPVCGDPEDFGPYCSYCHGLGKVFAPGDALTAKEAWELRGRLPIEYQIESEIGGWTALQDWQMNKPFPIGWKFRVAPAPQEEPIAKTSKLVEVISHIRQASVLWEIEGNGAFASNGARKMAEYFLSLSSEQFEALKKELP